MSRPTQGKVYTVVNGDSLSSIAEIAYGDPSQWPLIYDANLKTLRSTDPNLIFPGEVLIIPEDPTLRTIKENALVPDSIPDGMAIKIADRFINIQSGKIISTMNTAADAWSAVIEWQPGKDLFIDNVTRPYSYEKTKAYIDGNELVTGPLFITRPLKTTSGSSKTLTAFSATVSIVDSELKPDQYEQNNVSLRERAATLLKSYGLSVVVENGANVDEKFTRVTAAKNEKIFDHLKKLAKQKKVLISSTSKGNLLLTRANVDEAPVGIIEEASVNSSLRYTATFDGRKRFSDYRVTCQTPRKRDKKAAITKDKNVPIMRFKNLTVQNSTTGNIQDAADWARSKQFAEALTIPFPVPSWYAPNGDIWRVNKTVIVKSKTLSIPDGYKFLIDRVEYDFDEQGKRATLFLVPPETYTGEEIIEPWSN